MRFVFARHKGLTLSLSKGEGRPYGPCRYAASTTETTRSAGKRTVTVVPVPRPPASD